MEMNQRIATLALAIVTIGIATLSGWTLEAQSAPALDVASCPMPAPATDAASTPALATEALPAPGFAKRCQASDSLCGID